MGISTEVINNKCRDTGRGEH